MWGCGRGVYRCGAVGWDVWVWGCRAVCMGMGQWQGMRGCGLWSGGCGLVVWGRGYVQGCVGMRSGVGYVAGGARAGDRGVDIRA